MSLPGAHLGPADRATAYALRRPGASPNGCKPAAENMPEAELREAVIKHVHYEAKLYPETRQTGPAARFVFGHTVP